MITKHIPRPIHCKLPRTRYVPSQCRSNSGCISAHVWRKNLTFCALLNLTKVLLQDDEVDHKKQKTENGSNGAAAEDEGEEEEDAEEEEDIDGEEEEDVDGEGEEDLDEEEGGEGETLIATSSLFTFAQKAHISIVALHKTQCSFTIGCACFKNAANTASFISSINVSLQGNFWSPGEGYLYSHTSKPSVVGNYRSFEVSDLSCSLESFMTIDSKTND